ncbi:MAG TPA: hypothetical protein VNY52_13050 [Solirubrobacteraceae bacterium]|jgi:hypothetical protein|nr:hypothetical protein [Solirubrobacteraceae bacterium]
MVATSLSELAGSLWPLVVLICVLVLVMTKRGNGVIRMIRHVKGPGFELDLEPDSAGQFKEDIEGVFAESRKTVRTRFDALAHQRNINRLRDRVAEEILLPAKRTNEMEVRCAIYVEDILFKDALYALTDYYPSGKHSGSVYSIRFGIIGRQWRLREGTYNPDVSIEPAVLMQDWGMTKAEANSRAVGKSFVVAMLRHEDVEQGLLFVAADEKDAFESDIHQRIENSEVARQLGTHLEVVNREMRVRGPALKLFDA